jgi:hypothetical protein
MLERSEASAFFSLPPTSSASFTSSASSTSIARMAAGSNDRTFAPQNSRLSKIRKLADGATLPRLVG